MFSKDLYNIFTKILSGTWVLTYNSSDGKIAREKLQMLKIHATHETKKIAENLWQNLCTYTKNNSEKFSTRTVTLIFVPTTTYLTILHVLALFELFFQLGMVLSKVLMKPIAFF